MASSTPDPETAVSGSPTSPTASTSPGGESRARRASIGQRIRTASVTLMDANPPGGMWSATGQIASKMPSLQSMRSSSYTSQGSKRRSSTGLTRQSTTNSIQASGNPITRQSTTGSLQSPTRKPRQSSFTMRGSAPQANRESASTFDSAQFVTPSQSPLPVLDHEMTEEPEDEDEQLGSKGKATQDRADMTGGEDIAPAIAMMSRDDAGPASYASSTKSNVTLTKKQVGEDASTARTAVPADGQKRRTRDFADMFEGGDKELSTLFGRDEMGTQSYQRKPKGSASAIKPAQRKARPTVRSVEATDEHEEEQDHQAAQEAELEEFMRDFDDRPAAAQKRSSKTMSQLFGVEDEEEAEATRHTATPKPGSRLSMAKPLDQIDETSPNGIDQKTGLSRGLAADSENETSGNGVLSTSEKPDTAKDSANSISSSSGVAKIEPDDTGVYPNGYRFPPKKTSGQATASGLKWFFTDIFLTPMGFLWTIYGLNVVAWGGMLFLLLCNASKWMCQLGNGGYDCNDIDSPRRVWVEVDSQILNALFCVTGFGFIPWRFRDLYFLLRYRLGGDYAAWRRLAGWHSGWFRLQGSETLPVPATLSEDRVDPAAEVSNPTYPTSLKYVPLLPPTGQRAPATKPWKMDYVVWAFVINTFLQAVLSGFMWGLNRYARPSWSTGLFVGLACMVAALGGIMQFTETNRIKKIEGVAWEDPDRETSGV